MDDSLESITTQEGPLTPDSLLSVAPDSLDPSSPDDSPGDSSTDLDISSAEDDNTEYEINQAKRDLLSNYELRPPIYRPPTARRHQNLHPRIKARRKYAATQRAWKKSRGKVVRDILAGKDPLSVPTIPPGTKDYWVDLFTRPSPPILEEFIYGRIDILNPITLEEIQWLKGTISVGSAPGPDGLSSLDLKRVPDEELLRVYNLKLQRACSTEYWQEARTTLIPKVDNPESPTEFRPITISSTLTRGLHKILAKRLAASTNIDAMQRGLKAEDGVAANLLIIKSLLKAAKKTPSTVYVAFIDFKKAFDSVFHGAILESVAQAGVNKRSADYLASVYKSLTTDVMGERVVVRRGVAQGDPLSPTLFNLTLQRALRAIPEQIGIPTPRGTVRWMAFADDILVVASPPKWTTTRNKLPITKSSPNGT